MSERARGSFDLCPVCCWEDDSVQFEDPSYAGGANHESLETARANFRSIGACSPSALARVRPPHPEERP